MTEPRVYILDALNYIYRAFYAVPDITTPTGMPKNAIVGYTRSLLRIVREQRPEYLVAAFEGYGSFRSQLFKQYKENRAETPENLAPQIDFCRRMTEAMGIPTFDARGFEADDIIGTISMKMWSRGYPAVIVTGDKDLAQLVRPGVCVYDLAHDAWLDEARVLERFGVRPNQIPDLLALNGDAVDNIPGVPGVGPKTAREILAVCGNVEGLANEDCSAELFAFRSRDRILQRIRQTMETIRLSRKLATIRCDAPLTITPDAVRYRKASRELLVPLCRELGLENLLEEIPLSESDGREGVWSSPARLPRP